MLLLLRHCPISSSSILRSSAYCVQKRAYIPFSSARTAISAISSALTSSASAKPLHYHATRTLSYPKSALYNIVTDIESYPQFLPLVLEAKVLASIPASASSKEQTGFASRPLQNRSLPAIATLAIGLPENAPGADLLSLKGITRASFVSNVYCAPHLGIVEAVAGEERNSMALSTDKLGEHGYTENHSRMEGYGTNVQDIGPEIFKVCRTVWTLTGMEPSTETDSKTNIDLKIDIEWKHALMAAMTTAAAPKIAELMVEAFERRARELLT